MGDCNAHGKKKPFPRQDLCKQSCNGRPTTPSYRCRGSKEGDTEVPHFAWRVCCANYCNSIRENNASPYTRKGTCDVEGNRRVAKSIHQRKHRPPSHAEDQQPLVSVHSAKPATDKYKSSVGQAVIRSVCTASSPRNAVAARAAYNYTY